MLLYPDCSSSIKPSAAAVGIIRRMEKLCHFCNALDTLHVRYGVLIARDDAVMVTVVSPGQYLELEFFNGGSVEIERFLRPDVR